MGMSVSSNPKVIYTQATEPTDKTAGLLWFKTTENALYTADGTNYNKVVGLITPSDCSATFTPSDDLLFSSDADTSDFGSGSYALVEQIATVTDTALQTNTIRVKFQFVSIGVGTSYAKIYRDRGGVKTAVGTERTNNTGSWSGVISEDIAGWENGDIIELWGYSPISARAKDKRLYGTGSFSPAISVSFA